MNYWRQIADRAFTDALIEVRWDKPVRIIRDLVAVLGSAGMALMITHQFTLVVLGGIAGVAALLVVLFVWKMVSLPPLVHKEMAKKLERQNESERRDGIIKRLAGLYVQSGEGGPNQNWDMTYGFALPPQDWLNMKLAEIGEDWSVHDIRGPHYSTFEIVGPA